MRPLIVTLLVLASCTPRTASTPTPALGDFPPALDAISETDLRADLLTLAGDAMQGREAGTLDELRASMWLAERARAAGLLPAGDDGTYFQYWPLRRVRQSASSRITIGGRQLVFWRDAIVLNPVDATVAGPVVFVGDGRDVGVEVRGRVAAAVLSAPANPPAPGMSLYAYRYALAAARQRAAFLTDRGATAVILISDSIADSVFDWAARVLARGRYELDSAPPASPPARPVPVILVRRSAEEWIGAGGRLEAALNSETWVAASVNVVARVPGLDQSLGAEHVLFSGHQDHDGMRLPIAGDSIWNGADDNASTSVALLAIGRAFARRPARRSALFVWHGAEERGLLGSRWYAWRPTVPREGIVAVLNGDMIGRNHPDSAALLGAQPPHRNSADLVAMAFAANERVSRFVVDTLWDRPAHPEFWYFRSDHLPYARAGIPALFFTTLLHPDYHTPRDEPARIDVPKLARMTRWMYATGWAAANASVRPRLDEGFRLER